MLATAIIKADTIKRCYVDLDLSLPCPKCQNLCKFESEYLPFPEPGDTEIPFYCNNCDEYLTLPITIMSMHIIINYDPSKLEIQ